VQTFRKRRAGLSATAGLSCFILHSCYDDLTQPENVPVAGVTPSETTTAGDFLSFLFMSVNELYLCEVTCAVVMHISLELFHFLSWE